MCPQDNAGKELGLEKAATGKKALPAGLIKTLVIITVITAGAFLTSRFFIKNTKDTESIRVQDAAVQRGDMEISVTATGTIEAIRTEDVTSNIEGKAKQIYVSEGDLVKKDDVICDIENSTVEEELITARLALENAKLEVRRSKEELGIAKTLDLQHAQERLKINRELYEQKAIAKIEVVSAERDYEKAKLAFTQSEWDLEKKRTDLTKAELEMKNILRKYTIDEDEFFKRDIFLQTGEPLFKPQVKASFSGLITKLPIKAGDNIKSDTKICTLVDTSKWLARVDVDEMDIRQVKEGQLANIEGEAFSPEALSGAVSNIGTVAKKKGRITAVSVECLIDDTKGISLRPGTATRVKIIIATHRNTLIVPLESVVKSGGKRAVYILEGNVASIRVVEVGVSDKRKIEILSGLSEGERIVTVGALDLEGKERAEVILK